MTASPDVAARLNASKGGGSPLPDNTRSSMESAFGADFSGVRVHTGSEAVQMSRDLSAQAFTHGKDVYFGEGKYSPGTRGGERLLAHELTHVGQQGGAIMSKVQRQIECEPLLQTPLTLPAGSTKRSVQRMCAECKAETNGHAFPEIQRFPDLSSLSQLNILGLFDWRQVIDFLGDNVLSNLNLPFSEIPFPFDDPFELPIPWPTLPSIDPWEIIRKIIEYLKGGPDIPGGGGGIAPARQNPLADITTFQSPGGSGWRGAIFGCYRNSCTRPHRGWDIHAPVGTDIIAAETGAVTHGTDANGYGNYIFLTVGTVRYRYAHLSAREAAGQYNAGDVIGQTGVSGNAEADRPHLHLEVQENNAAVDPAGYFDTPSRVRGAVTPFSVTDINFAEPENCNPCAM